MDAVHRVQNRPWVSEVINVREFLSEWTKHWQQVKDFYTDSEDLRRWRQKFMEEMDIQRNVMESLERECSPNVLTCEGEKTTGYAKTSFSIPEGVDLQTLRLQQQDLLKRSATKAYRVSTHRGFRHHELNKVARPHVPFKEIEMPEVILLVQVYRPQKRPDFTSKRRKRKAILHVEDEFAVLGSQPLIKLAERISCVSDVSISGDFSNNPNVHKALRAHEVYTSGFFYINGTFYNNMSKPENIDYSKVIIDWAENPSHAIGPFKTATMENTTFLELELQLGYPYVYQHQGDCEHLIVFTDLRLVHPDDWKNANSYPILEAAYPRPRVSCMVCNLETARWITYDSSRLPENPYFFCESCFLSFNYTVDGEKIGEFRAHPYVDRTAML